MSDAAKMAMDGLEMGFRVLGSRINEVLADCHIKDRINCGPKRDGDSMATARALMIRSLPVLSPLDFPQGDVSEFVPWVLGYPHGMRGKDVTEEDLKSRRWIRRVRLYGPDVEDLVVDYSGTETKTKPKSHWSPDDWWSSVIQPMEDYHAEVVDWIRTQSGEKRDGADPKAVALKLAEKWLSLPATQYISAKSQLGLVRELVKTNGTSDVPAISIAIGSRWGADDKKALRSIITKLNKRLSNENEGWLVKMIGEGVFLRPKG